MHPNIVHFEGACLRPPEICLVYEYCSEGDLASFLFKHSNFANTDQNNHNIGNNINMYQNDSGIHLNKNMCDKNIPAFATASTNYSNLSEDTVSPPPSEPSGNENIINNNNVISSNIPVQRGTFRMHRNNQNQRYRMESEDNFNDNESNLSENRTIWRHNNNDNNNIHTSMFSNTELKTDSKMDENVLITPHQNELTETEEFKNARGKQSLASENTTISTLLPINGYEIDYTQYTSGGNLSSNTKNSSENVKHEINSFMKQINSNSSNTNKKNGIKSKQKSQHSGKLNRNNNNKEKMEKNDEMQSKYMKMIDDMHDMTGMKMNGIAEASLSSNNNNNNITNTLGNASSILTTDDIIQSFQAGLTRRVVDNYKIEKLLSFQNRLFILLDIAKAMQFLHSQNILHRDLKVTLFFCSFVCLFALKMCFVNFLHNLKQDFYVFCFVLFSILLVCFNRLTRYLDCFFFLSLLTQFFC